MKKVLVFGAGALALDAFRYTRHKYDIVGFISEDGSFEPRLHEAYFDRPQQSSSVIWLHKSLGDALDSISNDVDLILAVFDPTAKQRVFFSVESELELVSIIHTTCLVDEHSVINKGTILDAYSSVAHNTILGRGTTVGRHSNLGHDNTIGDFSSIGPSVTFTRNSVVGDRCIIGANSVIMPNVEIADDVKIGPLTLVTRSISERGSTWIGNPSRRVR